MFRLGHWFLAAALVAGLAPHVATAQETAIGTPELSPVEMAAAKAGCDNSKLPGKPGGGALKRYEETFIAAHTEYDPKTCKPHGPGSWFLNDKGKCDLGKGCGKVTFGFLQNRPLASGVCAGHTYDFASLCYTWTLHSNLFLEDKIKATYVPPQIAPVTQTFPIEVRLVKPSGDTSKFLRWFDDGDGRGLWDQTLVAKSESGFDWSGTSVQETGSKADRQANDTCWCKGSTILPFFKITGGDWDVGDDGKWGQDGVGWNTDAIDYYRRKQRAPCGTTFGQQMQFKVVDTHPDWEDYGKLNTLGGSFDYKTMTSLRAGQSKTRDYKPGPKKARLACSKIRFASAPAAGPGDMATIDDPRPVMAAVMEIERVTGRAISYEDALVADRRAMAPMVAAGRDEAFLMPAGGVMTVALPRSAAAAAAATQAAVARYAAGQPVATFDVFDDGMIHVVPRGAQDASGRMAAVAPALDLPVTLKKKARTGMELLDELRRAVAAADGRPVLIGTVPAGALSRITVDFGAAGEPARAVLARLIAASGLNASWKLLYDPGFDEYALNLTVID